MEEKEPRNRSADAEFSAADRPPSGRRRKAAPPQVTFQPPAVEPRRSGTPAERADAESGRAASPAEQTGASTDPRRGQSGSASENAEPARGEGSSAGRARRARKTADGSTGTAPARNPAPQPPSAGRRKSTPRKATPPPAPAAPNAGTDQPAAAKPPAQRRSKAATPAGTTTPSKAATPPKATPPAKTATSAKANQPAEAPAPAEAEQPPAAATQVPAPPAGSEPPAQAAPQPETVQAASVAPAGNAAPKNPKKATSAVKKATKAVQAPTRPTEIPAQAQITEPIAAEAATPPEPPAETAKEPAATVPAETAPAPKRTEPWAQLVANPGHAPELLALAAVQTIGPRAADWARRMRERYPHATDASLARLAERQFIRFGGVGSVFAAAAGSYAPIALLGSNALTYAELILHVAAAHQVDPTDRRRAVDLLVLTQVHPTPEDAEAALTTAEQPAYEEETHLTDAVWRLARMASAQAAAWAIVKQVNRVFPGVTFLSAIITSRSGVRTVGTRAVRFYSRHVDSGQSQLSQDSGSRV